MHKATRQDRSILHSLSYSQMDKAKHIEKLGKTKVPAFQYYGNVISRLSTQWPSSERLKGREQAQGFLKRQDIHKTPVPRGTDVIPSPPLYGILSLWSLVFWLGTANGEPWGPEGQSTSWFPTSRSPWIACFLTEGSQTAALYKSGSGFGTALFLMLLLPLTPSLWPAYRNLIPGLILSL